MTTKKKMIKMTKAAKPMKKAVVPSLRKTNKLVKKTLPAAKVSGLSVSVAGTDGKAKGTITMPKELFDGKINKQLMAQAVRVYLANQREGSAATKTRGKVEGSTRKIYRQKGTGRARHGSIRANIFVGGGIVFGPVPRDYTLSMPKAMKRKALVSALTSQFRDNNIVVADGLDELQPKTKPIAQAIASIAGDVSVLLVYTPGAATVVRSARNIENVDLLQVTNLNTYDVLAHQKIVFMKGAIYKAKEIFVPSGNQS